jgi:hypothetical protein
VGALKSLGHLSFGPVVLLCRQKVGIKYKKPLLAACESNGSQWIARFAPEAVIRSHCMCIGAIVRRPNYGRSHAGNGNLSNMLRFRFLVFAGRILLNADQSAGASRHRPKLTPPFDPHLAIRRRRQSLASISSEPPPDNAISTRPTDVWRPLNRECRIPR